MLAAPIVDYYDCLAASTTFDLDYDVPRLLNPAGSTYALICVCDMIVDAY